jgi:hypothetical protein
MAVFAVYPLKKQEVNVTVNARIAKFTDSLTLKIKMKQNYTAPKAEILGIRFEENILSGPKSTGASTGSNMDAADYSQNPF